jgi:hypothetical protein
VSKTFSPHSFLVEAKHALAASTILAGTGSIGLSLIWWALGFVTSTCAFAVYLEFTSFFPSRSGAEVVYLEQAYPKPRWLMSTAFAFRAVILSFSSGNSYGK